MPKNKVSRTLLPAKNKEGMKRLVAEPAKEVRRNVSVACTECQKKKTKCSGTTPCTICATKARHCTYDRPGDRRSKAYTAWLLNSHAALCRLVVKLRSGNLEEISRLIWDLQSLPNDQEATNYLVHMQI